MEKCIPNINFSDTGNSTNFSDKKANINAAFLSFVLIGFALNLLLMIILLVDRKLLRRKFSWFIFFQCVFDCLALLVQSCRVWIGAKTIFTFYLYLYSFSVILSISIWMLALRSFTQQRVIRKGVMPTENVSECRKITALIATLKTLAPLWIASIFVNFILPIGFCQTMLEAYLFNYPSTGAVNWRYFLLASNLTVMYIPAIIMILCSGITVAKICTPNRMSLHNRFSRAMFLRRKQSSMIICAFTIAFLVLVMPSQICRFYLFFNQIAKIHHLWHELLNYISYLYIPLNPCIVFILSFEIRRKFKNFIHLTMSKIC